MHSIRWRLAAAHALVVLTTGAIALAVLLPSVHRALTGNLEQRLVSGARAASVLLTGRMVGRPTIDAINPIARSLGASLGARVTIVLPNGYVVGDSEADPRHMENHADRPEIRTALARGAGETRRFSSTTGVDRLYVAEPIRSSGRVVGVLRLSLPLSEVDRQVGALTGPIVLSIAVAAVVAILLGLWIASSISTPVRQLTAMAHRLAQGDLSQRARVPPGDEVGDLAASLNAMASQLDAAVGDLAMSERTMRAVVSGMTDGIILTDAQGFVSLFNPAAEQMLHIGADRALGRTVLDATLNKRLSDMVARALEQRECASMDVVLHQPDERVLSAYVAPVETEGAIRGAVAILHDLTEARRMEEMRREFVANASHELKTPLSSVKLMVETLLSGAKDDPDAEDRFLRVIATETDRLVSVVEDMIRLSAAEGQAAPLRQERVPVRDAAAAAISHVQPVVSSKGQTLVSQISDDAVAYGDPEAVERILTNLLDNATKYTNEGGEIRLSAWVGGGEVLLHVSDTGIGIPAEHLPRIFERFYRVDKARSRAAGGTGLGLAIVKHLVERMGGRMHVESTPGKGSTFTVALPLPPDTA